MTQYKIFPQFNDPTNQNFIGKQTNKFLESPVGKGLVDIGEREVNTAKAFIETMGSIGQETKRVWWDYGLPNIKRGYYKYLNSLEGGKVYPITPSEARESERFWETYQKEGLLPATGQRFREVIGKNIRRNFPEIVREFEKRKEDSLFWKKLKEDNLRDPYWNTFWKK